MSTTNFRRLLPLAALALTCALGACSWLRADRTGYQQSRETRPLEVPPDLDSPATATELTIPGSGTATARSTGSTASAAPPSVPPSSGTQAPSSYVGTETTLVLTDEASSAWRRVAIALERSGVMTVVAKDEAAGSVTLKREMVKTEGGWFRKMIGQANTKPESVTRVVRVVAEGAGSRVHVEDEAGRTVEDESARQIIAAVKQRLG
jgi:uncharacterized lipoprotein